MKSIAIAIANIIMKCFYRIFWIYRINDNKIVVVSFYGKGYGDSGRYICDELIKKNKKLDIVWLYNGENFNDFPKYIRVVKYGSIKAFFELATAKIWIDNSRKMAYFSKRKGQKYLQTWHSNLRLKKIEKDAERFLPKNYIKRCRNDSKMADAMIAGSDFGYETIRKAFWYDGPIYKTGIPRCDELFNTDNKATEVIMKKYHIEKNTTVILYAPTFRNNGMKVGIEDIGILIEMLKEKYENNFKLLVRFHPISEQKIEETAFIKDVTKYPNMQNLLAVSDFLITDYSGCMFDAAVMHKKCILYVPDYEEYIKNNRDLYFSFDELPFPRAMSTEQLAKIIIEFNKKNYDSKVDEFLKRVGCYEKGESAKNVSKIIDKWLRKKNEQK